jgi:AcrR family transcriptional regulator
MPALTEIAQPKKIDPRVLRTRRLLLDSFSELLQEHKNIRKISISSITENAGVNRVTFYAHFNDKYELLSAWKREMFRNALSDSLMDDQMLSEATYEQVIKKVFDFMTSFKRYFRRINREYEPLFEAAVQNELKDVLKTMLSREQKLDQGSNEITATFLSWAIFGIANEWAIKPLAESKDEMIKQLSGLVRGIVG